MVNDQQGSPTYAADLASTILHIITHVKDPKPGIYHYCNEGSTNWYAFASAIKELTGSRCRIEPIPTSAYPTPAKRPSFSLLDNSLIKETFGIKIPIGKTAWRHAYPGWIKSFPDQYLAAIGHFPVSYH